MTTKRDRNKDKDPGRRVRMLGEREEKVITRLTPLQVEDRRQVALDVLDDIERLEDEAKQAASAIKGKIKELKASLKRIRREVKENKITEELTVQEWLTADNQVIRVRKDTDTQIGDPRTARTEELQEKLFPDKNDAEAGEREEDAFPEAETPDTFGAQPGGQPH